MPKEEFRLHFASLSEEGLREIHRDDLTEDARVCYDEELASRGLTIESAPPEPEPTTDDIGWVPLSTFNPEEVQMVRALLDAEGIPSDVDTAPAENYPPVTAGSVVFVPEQLLEQARDIVAARISDEDLIAQAEAYDPPEDA